MPLLQLSAIGICSEIELLRAARMALGFCDASTFGPALWTHQGKLKAYLHIAEEGLLD
jgi:hypothetical protein